MSAGLIRGNAMAIPLRDESVDLIVTSPPYFALRSYRDDGEHYDGQIGSEPTPQAFLEALWSVMHECWRVLKPEGVCFVNLGDKRSGSGGHNNSNLGATSALSSKAKEYHAGHGERRDRATRRNAPDRYNQAAFGRPKSKMLLPHRFAIGCEDGLADPEGKGWIVRQDIVWEKMNGLPESVTDRPRDSHEMWFMLCKLERYYSAMDEIRVGNRLSRPQSEWNAQDWQTHRNLERGAIRTQESYNAAMRGERHKGSRAAPSAGGPGDSTFAHNPLGKLPGSVWAMPGEPLRTPEYMILPRAGSMAPQWLGTEEDAWRWMRWSGVDRSPWPRPDHGEPGPFLCTGPDHFAAFVSEWPRRLILGWSPPGVCTACGEGRRPVVTQDRSAVNSARTQRVMNGYAAGTGTTNHGTGGSTLANEADKVVRTITGYACACPSPDAPTTPPVILDPFCGTGTVPMVARALGRYGVGIDLSADYLRLARWRTFDSGGAARAVARTNREAQGQML